MRTLSCRGTESPKEWLGQLGRVGDWSSATAPRQPPLIEPDVRFSLIRLSDGVHVVAVASQA